MAVRRRCADEIRAGNIRAVPQLRRQPPHRRFPDANDLEPALRELEVLATIEIIANATTAISTHVLPTKDQLERADVTLWDFLGPRVSAQHTPAVVDPVGDRRSTWWVLAELGRRLGYELADPDATDDERLAAVMATAARCPYDDVAATASGGAASSRRRGSTPTSNGRAGGASRRSCSSTSSSRSTARAAGARAAAPGA